MQYTTGAGQPGHFGAHRRLDYPYLRQAVFSSTSAREREMGGIAFDTAGLNRWDSGFVTFVRNINAIALTRKLPVDDTGLPVGVR